MFEHSGGVAVVELTTTLEPFLNMEPYAAPSLVANSGDMSTLIIPERPFSPKILFECFDPR